MRARGLCAAIGIEWGGEGGTQTNTRIKDEKEIQKSTLSKMAYFITTKRP